ncbi:MAG: hydrolase [Polyangiaceae bacterium]|jgi:8-oxo-dGTP pyrophosphatase MutT (NUDIX family)|nr:hydrolase [Polyangiaceae bacterium]
MLAENQEGHRLVRLLDAAEADLAEQGNLTHARLVARHDDKVLLVFDRRTQRWQLPGGAIEAGETARVCAARELREESSNECDPASMRYLFGFELFLYGTRFDQHPRAELGALFEVPIHHLASFIPTEEIGATLWWSGSELSHELDGIDRQLIQLARPIEPALDQELSETTL